MGHVVAEPDVCWRVASDQPGHAIMEPTMPSITPFLWFDTQAEEAAKFYTTVFSNSKIVETT